MLHGGRVLQRYRLVTLEGHSMRARPLVGVDYES